MDVLEAPNGALIKGLGCSRPAAAECSIRRRQSPVPRHSPAPPGWPIEPLEWKRVEEM